MFTGLIGDLGSVTAFEQNGAGATLSISTRLADELTAGDSIAVNGVCLTATEVRDASFEAQAMLETLNRSALGSLRSGARVNLEMPLRVGDRLGGHFVQGHVDGTGKVRALTKEGFSRAIEIEIEPPLRRYLVGKGSVAVDGVSLTVSGVLRDGFSVSLIPETLTRTNLGALDEGDRVNIEVDILAKHAERLMQARP